jgi:hypothetical protein
MDKDTFVRRLIEVLNNENEGREHPLNIPFLVSSVEQHIGEPQYATFLEEIEGRMEYWSFIEREKDDYYSFGKVFIPTSEDNHSGVYYLTLGTDERMWGYCFCKPGDEDYNPKHRCCGHGCDWSAPAFTIIKEVSVGRSAWNGDEAAYWRYEEDMLARLARMNSDYVRQRREQRVSYLRGEIERLQGELRKVKEG